MNTPHNPTPSITHPPLEGDWIERPLALVVEGRPLVGIARANWGAIEVTITSPIAGLTRVRDGRGWAFAMLCHHYPERRFALGGRLTDNGIQAARKLLADIYLDWRAIAQNGDEMDAACRRTRQELAELGRSFEALTQPARREKQVLRRAFKAGELTQRDYQRRLKELGKQIDRIGCEWRLAEEVIGMRFAARVQSRWGRKVSLEEAERLLAEVAVVVEAAGP
jgi:hypothetical protein